MFSPNYTITVIRGHRLCPLTFRVPVLALVAGLLCLCTGVALVAQGWWLRTAQIHSVQKANASLMALEPERDILRQQVAQQNEQLQEYATRIKSIQATLDRLGELEAEVRTLIDEAEPAIRYTGTAAGPAGALAGIGGPAGEDESVADTLLWLEPEANALHVAMLNASKELKQRADFLAHRPIGMPVSGDITSQFGRRRSPFGYGYETHTGLDIGANGGDIVRATGNGTVITAGWLNSGYGYTVEVDHGYGLVSRYAHNSTVQVKVGQMVSRGDAVARAGSSGRSTGPHVHYEIRLNGKPVDPAGYLR